MNKQEWNEGLNHLDPDLVEKYIEQKDLLRQKKNTKGLWLRIGALAACFALIVSAIIVVPMLRKDGSGIIPGPSIGNDPGVVPGPGVEIELPCPPAYSTYHYDSYEELCKALTDPLSPQFMQLRLEQEHCGEVYQQTLADFASGEIKVAVPQINGENIKLRDREGFSMITWFTNELYNLPWVWYHCWVNEQNLTVNIANLRVLDQPELDSATSYREVLKIICPSAPNPDNYGDNGSYEKIYEKEITLGNGKQATAMITEPKNDSRIYVCLYLDGVLVLLWGEEALLTEDFLKTFRLAYM